MSEFRVRLLQFINMNPIFKGSSVIIVGLLALLFVLWMRAKWKEPFKGGLLVFIGLAVFIVLYGFLILILRPNWWVLPY